MNYLSICAIVKNESGYLEEWVRYHQAVGVEKFYLFDHESDVPVAEELKRFVDDGTVSVSPISGTKVQVKLYTWFIQSSGVESNWMAFIDLDEFLVPVKEDDLRVFLKDYEPFGGLGVNWLMFGSSGHLTRPPGLVIENYLRRAKKDVAHNRHIKSIVQPAKVLGAGTNPHYFIYKESHFCVNEFKQGIPYAYSPHSTKLIQLNHYNLKSKEEFEGKVRRGLPDRHSGGLTMEMFDERDAYYNEEEDRTILRFVDRVRS